NAKRHALARFFLPHLAIELRARADLLRLDLENDVALFEARFFRRPAGNDAGDDDMAAHELGVEAEPRALRAALDAAELLQLRLVLHIHLDRDRERGLGDVAQVERDDAD